jgi:two-component system, cell cycle response regulator
MQGQRNKKFTSFWCTLGIGLLCNGIFLLLLLFKPGSHNFFLFMDNLITPLYILLVILDLLITAHKIRRGKRLRPASQPAPRRRPIERWGLAVFLFAALGQLLGYTITLIAGQPPHPLVDLCDLSCYPALICLFLLFPGHVLSKATRLRLIMDSIMVMIAVGMFSWYFLLGPMLFQSSGGTVGKIMLSLYPSSDFALLLCLVLIAPRVSESSMQPVIGLFSLAVIMEVVSDSIAEYQVVHNMMAAGTLLDIGWTITFMFAALAVQFMQTVSFAAQNSRGARVSAKSEEIIQQKYTARLSMGYALLPYLLVPAFAGLSIFVLETEKNSIIALGIYGSAALLFLLLLLRQIIAMREFAGFAKTTQHLNNELQTVNQQLESLATTDPLTELPNHRALITLLNQELGFAESYQRSCSLLFLDLDHFKALNDGYGHAGGDIALREFGSLLRTKLNTDNIVGRWGGEEFIVILPEQDAGQAAQIAEELRIAVANFTFTIGGGIRMTCSIGVASYPVHAHQQEALLQAADSAMYGAKRLGRNQVRLIDDAAVVTLLATNAAVEGRDEVALVGTVHALTLLVEKRDPVSGELSQKVGDLLSQLAQVLGLSEAEAQLLSLAGQLHDIGKIIIPDSILEKQEPLTEQELACIRMHPQVGAEVVSSIPSLRVLAPVICAHHEWWNGKGYPSGQAGEAIPFGARLLAVVDAYVAMTTKRRYQEADTPTWALAELQRGAGTQFDPTVVEQFILLMTEKQADKNILALRM